MATATWRMHVRVEGIEYFDNSNVCQGKLFPHGSRNAGGNIGPYDRMPAFALPKVIPWAVVVLGSHLDFVGSHA
jgi:hypothetical protein